MFELVSAIRVVGIRRLVDLGRAYRHGWMGILTGFYTTRTLQALFNVGFFEELEARDRVDLDLFAQKKDLDPQILKALCDSLVALKILDRRGKEYFLDSKGRLLAETARGWFVGTYGYESVFHNLEALLEKKKEYGKDVLRLAEPIARGSAEMEALLYFPLAADIVARKGYKRVLDLGCGEGTFLRSLCQAVPGVEGVGMDIAPESIEAARSKAAQAGLDGRLRFVVEDVAAWNGGPSKAGPIDAATIFFVMHEILYRGEDAAVEFLRGFQRKFPGVPLIVFEVLRPSVEQMRRRPGMAIHYALQHDLSHQKLVSGAEWMRLFEKAGFRNIDERELKFVRSVIYTLS
jgi:SAM-dependent methyltransferase